MISIYDFTDYREFLRAWLASAKTNQRGGQGRLATAVGVSSTMMSLIFKGQKQLSMEQASDAADFLGLNEKESDYFFLLVEFGRAGSFKLQQKFKKRIKDQQDLSKKISRRVKKDIELTDEQKAVYYSTWLYTGIRNLSALGEFNDLHSMAKRLNLPAPVIAKALEFLIENSLCLKENSQLTFGPAHTHVDSDSPYVTKHHQNWRLRGFQFMDTQNEDDLFYTCPMSLSKEAVEEVRRLLPKFIEQILKIVGPSPSEKVYCFNMDWFEY